MSYSKSDEVKEPHTLPGETPGQRVEREKKEAPKTELTEVEIKAQEEDLARLELEFEKAKAAIVNRNSPAVDSAALSVAHSLSIANSAPKTNPKIEKVSTVVSK